MRTDVVPRRPHPPAAHALRLSAMQRSALRRYALSSLGALALLLWSAGDLRAEKIPGDPKNREWERVTEEDGIVVHMSDVPGRSLPTFRGEGVVEASLFEILAVLDDTDRAHEWIHRCMESRVLERFGQGAGRIVYIKTDAPWPVSDRDVVLRTSVEQRPESLEIVARFRAVNGEKRMPVTDDAVRMVRLGGIYHLKWEAPLRTRVIYEVDSDPGGSLPAWVARLATKTLPLNTVRNLRKQVKKTRGEYEAFLDAWDSRRGGRSTLRRVPGAPTTPRQDGPSLRADD